MKNIVPQRDLSKRKSKIIAIEGFDAVGKHTQTMELKKYFEGKGLKVGTISLPDYEEPSADLINRWLKREYNLNNAYVIASLYAINRFNAIFYNEDVLNSIMNDDIFIFDRYTGSNILHTMSIIPEDRDEDKVTFVNFIRMYEHNLLGIPNPDITIFLDLAPDTAHKLCVKRAEKEGRIIDKNEDLEFQKECYHNKNTLRMIYPTNIIDCNKYDNNWHSIGILSIENINNKIIDVVESIISVN